MGDTIFISASEARKNTDDKLQAEDEAKRKIERDRIVEETTRLVGEIMGAILEASLSGRSAVAFETYQSDSFEQERILKNYGYEVEISYEGMSPPKVTLQIRW